MDSRSGLISTAHDIQYVEYIGQIRVSKDVSNLDDLKRVITDTFVTVVEKQNEDIQDAETTNNQFTEPEIQFITIKPEFISRDQNLNNFDEEDVGYKNSANSEKETIGHHKSHKFDEELVGLWNSQNVEEDYLGYDFQNDNNPDTLETKIQIKTPFKHQVGYQNPV
eukprot:GFUD01006516.1.p1 GENE.GFUD01006516.1~~GFUD01006516.1.p1  ORF type:complete len:166 (+),score=40.60 GFUD01006516.1:196-693(+)